MNHLEALRTIAEYPASAQDDMQAANMRKIAQEALAGDVERLRSGVAREIVAAIGAANMRLLRTRDGYRIEPASQAYATKAQPAVEPVAEWKQSTQGHPYWPHPIPHKGVPLPDGWLDDYITDCAKLNPGEMPGVYFVQGVRFAEQHHWGTSPAPAPNALDAETAIKNCLEAGETMRVLKRVVNLLLESRRNLGPEDHELRDRIDQLFRPDAAIAAQSAQGAKP